MLTWGSFGWKKVDQTSCKLHADFAATSYELRELRKFICICMLTSVNLWRTKLSNLNPTLYGLRTSPSQTTFELTLLCACVNSRNFAPEVRYCIQDYFEKRRNIIQDVSSANSPCRRKMQFRQKVQAATYVCCI